MSVDGEPIQDARPVAAGILPVDPPHGGPQEEQISLCTAALLRGDFGEARRAARRLLAKSPLDDAERAFAQQVLRRTDADPVALALGLASSALFFAILYLTLWR